MSETISARFCPSCLAPLRATDRACRVCGWRIADTLETLPTSAWRDPLAAGRGQPKPLPPILTSGPAPHLSPPSPSPAAARSRTLTAIVVLLGILPLLLPFPSTLVTLKWVLPVIVPEFSHCPSYCPPSTDGERIEWLLILGPSLLVVVASLLLGTIGLLRSRRHPTSPNNVGLFKASMNCGIAWAVLGGCLYGVIFVITGIVP